MSIADQYDKTYFENGIAARVSGYKNYHWRPEYSMPFANELKRRFIGKMIHDCNEDRALDFGCAKGFLVKALRLLNVEAFGYDISEYAIKNADPLIRDFVSSQLPNHPGMFSLIVAKDVLEHVHYGCAIDGVLNDIHRLLHHEGRAVVTVPLGDKGEYRIREYELDQTHQIREDEEWWIRAFSANGLACEEFYYDFPGAKDHWLKVRPDGNGTFVLRARMQGFCGKFA